MSRVLYKKAKDVITAGSRIFLNVCFGYEAINDLMRPAWSNLSSRSGKQIESCDHYCRQCLQSPFVFPARGYRHHSIYALMDTNGTTR